MNAIKKGTRIRGFMGSGATVIWKAAEKVESDSEPRTKRPERGSKVKILR